MWEREWIAQERCWGGWKRRGSRRQKGIGVHDFVLVEGLLGLKWNLGSSRMGPSHPGILGLHPGQPPFLLALWVSLRGSFLTPLNFPSPQGSLISGILFLCNQEERKC